MKRDWPAPADVKAVKAWEKIMDIAREHRLVVQAYGGIATLATPDAQREHGIREWVLAMDNIRECDSDQGTLDLEPTP